MRPFVVNSVEEVIGVGDGLLALEQFDTNGPFDLILTDITMPNMDGESLVEELNKRDYTGPIVVLGALGHDEPIIRCMRAGAVDYLIKPVNLNDLPYNFQRLEPTNQTEVLKSITIQMVGLTKISGKSSYGILYRYAVT